MKLLLVWGVGPAASGARLPSGDSNRTLSRPVPVTRQTTFRGLLTEIGMGPSGSAQTVPCLAGIRTPRPPTRLVEFLQSSVVGDACAGNGTTATLSSAATVKG